MVVTEVAFPNLKYLPPQSRFNFLASSGSLLCFASNLEPLVMFNCFYLRIALTLGMYSYFRIRYSISSCALVWECHDDLTGSYEKQDGLLIRLYVTCKLRWIHYKHSDPGLYFLRFLNVWFYMTLWNDNVQAYSPALVFLADIICAYHCKRLF